jgi:catechol 2,3-dioxygenase-like lactoylglutathione lyase family enzyme
MLVHDDLIAFLASTLPDRASKFYREALGLPLIEETPYALVFDANGTTLRIQKVQTLSPARHTVLGWRVGDVRETVRVLLKQGVSFERYPGLLQDEDGIWTTPDGNQIAWFTDPDGNILSLTELRHT